jgi:glycosyltransferase involved in cell wall biosynthesis
MVNSLMNRVTHLITTIERGGAENQLLTLCQEQKRLGLEVDVLFLKGSPSLARDFQQIGVPVSKLFGSPIQQVVRLRKILRHGKSDIVHAHLPRAELIASLAISEKRLVISRHNAERFLPGGPIWLSKSLSKFVIKKSWARIAISQHVNEFIKSSGESVEGRDFSIIYYGYRFRDTESKYSSLLENFFPLIGCVARLVHQKNLFMLPELINSARFTFPNIKLLFIGEGPLERKLKSKFEELGISHHVDFVGKVSNPLDYIKELDILILPSFYEGFGLVLLEGMAVGTPMLLSDIPTTREVMGENYPWLFSPIDPNSAFTKLKQMLSISDLKKSSKEYYQSRLVNFEPERMAREIQRLYYTEEDHSVQS